MESATTSASPCKFNLLISAESIETPLRTAQNTLFNAFVKSAIMAMACPEQNNALHGQETGGAGPSSRRPRSKTANDVLYLT